MSDIGNRIQRRLKQGGRYAYRTVRQQTAYAKKRKPTRPKGMAPPVRDPYILHGKKRPAKKVVRPPAGAKGPITRKTVSHNNHVVASPPRGSVGHGAARPPRNTKPMRVRGKGGHVKMGGGGGRSRAGKGPKGYGEGMMGELDPDTYANALMDAEYGPILSELKRQETKERNIGTNRVAEIGDMYRTYTGDINARATESAAARQKAIADIAGLPQGLQVAMDPSVQAALMGASDISADTARTLATSEGDFDRRMAEAARLGGQFAGSQAQREADDAVQEILDQRKDVLAERGSKLTSTKMDMLKWMKEFGLEKRKTDLSALETMAGIQGMGLDTQKTQLEMDAIRSGILNDELGREGQRANIRYRNKATRLLGKGKGSSGFPRKFRALSPVDREALGSTILKRVGDPEGREPQELVRIINSSLKSYGYKPHKNARVGRFAFNLYQQLTGHPADPAWWGLGR